MENIENQVEILAAIDLPFQHDIVYMDTICRRWMPDTFQASQMMGILHLQ